MDWAEQEREALSWLEVDAPDNGTVARAQVHATLALVALGRELLMERRDTPDEGSGHVICNRLYNEAKDRYDAAIARAETAEGELAREESNHHVTIKRVREITAERDAERERAGRLAGYACHKPDCERGPHPSEAAGWVSRGSGICTCGVEDVLALPASDTKEDA